MTVVGGQMDSERDIIGRMVVDFYKPAIEERCAILEVTYNEKYGVAQHVEKLTSNADGIGVQFYIQRGKHLIGVWGLREVAGQFTQAVADLLNERGYKPKERPSPADVAFIPSPDANRKDFGEF